MKKCIKCGEIKKLSEYYNKQENNDGLMSACKECEKRREKVNRRSINGTISKIYIRQKVSSKHRGFPPPSYTKEQLKDFLINNKLFQEIYSNWVNSGYNKDLTPSVDRKRDDDLYTLETIQLMTWKENKDKSYEDRKNGNNNTVNKAVIQLDIYDSFINEYHSISQASRKSGVNASKISLVCNGKRKTAGGFKWIFKN